MPVIGAGGGREAGCGQHVDFRKRGVGEKRTDVRGHEVGEKRVAIGAPTCGYFFRASEPNCGIWDETYCLQLRFAASSFGRARHVCSLTTRRVPARWPRLLSC